MLALRRPLLFGLAAFATQLPSFAGDFFTVACDASGDFSSLSQAFAAVADGDVLYVLSGCGLDTVELVGKGVTIVRGGTHSGRIVEHLIVRDLPPTSRVVIHGLQDGDIRRFSAVDCSGAIVASDSTFGLTYGGVTSFHATDCAAVSLSSCVLHGDDGNSGSSGALRVERSVLVAEHLHVQGGAGAPGYDPGGICQTCCFDGGFGGSGLVVVGDSYVDLRHSVLRGGEGGSYTGINDCTSGPRGASYDVDSLATVVFREVTAQFGHGIGAPIVLTEQPHSLEVPASTASGATITIDAVGEAGDTLFVLMGGHVVAQPQVDLSQGVVQVRRAPTRLRLGSLPVSGTRTFQLTLPTVDPRTVTSVPMQGFFISPDGRVRVAPAAVLSIVGDELPTW